MHIHIYAIIFIAILLQVGIVYAQTPVTISFDKKEYTPFDKMVIEITAPDWNRDPASSERLYAYIYSSIDELEKEFLESGTNTGIFVAEIKLTPNKDLFYGDLMVIRGDNITVDFGHTEKVSTNYHLGEIRWDKECYRIDDRAILKVIDIDANRDPDSRDNITARIWSTTDSTGLLVTLRETDDRSGEFEEIITFTNEESTGTRLRVSENDTITAMYDDNTLPEPEPLDKYNVFTRAESVHASVLSCKLDHMAPSLSGLVEPSIVGTDGKITVTANAEDDTAIARVYATIIDQYDLSLISGTSEKGRWQGIFTFPRNIPDGEYIIIITAIDTSGKSIEQSAGSITLDRTPPKLVLPDPITEYASKNSVTIQYKATANDNIDGAITPECTPRSGSIFTGITTVWCFARDRAGNTATGSFTVTIMHPSVTNDYYETDEDTPLTVNRSKSVLLNDNKIFDSAVLISKPAKGTLEFNSDGTFTYKPDRDYNGLDSFTYQVKSAIDRATVTINIRPVNDKPIANADSVTIMEDSSKIIDVLANDRDVDGDSLTIIKTSNGSLEILGNSIKYTPPADFFGSDSFTYTVSDGYYTSSTTVSIIIEAVNDKPIADADSVTINEGFVKLNGSRSYDPDGRIIEYRWEQINGSKVMLDDPSSPIATFNAPDVAEETKLTFKLTVTDDGNLREESIVNVIIEPSKESIANVTREPSIIPYLTLIPIPLALLILHNIPKYRGVNVNATPVRIEVRYGIE